MKSKCDVELTNWVSENVIAIFIILIQYDPLMHGIIFRCWFIFANLYKIMIFLDLILIKTYGVNNWMDVSIFYLAGAHAHSWRLILDLFWLKP